MATFEFSRWDGSSEFTPQSADELFDQFDQYLLDHGEQVLNQLQNLEDQNPEALELPSYRSARRRRRCSPGCCELEELGRLRCAGR